MLSTIRLKNIVKSKEELRSTVLNKGLISEILIEIKIGKLYYERPSWKEINSIMEAQVLMRFRLR